ncbi:MAG: hypothetical protein K2M57_05995 [Paramuribaculum sp.]|nr:hypothetical protein [Paramuribaculum sp.]
MSDDTDNKWNELEHLPAWDEEYYEIWTARKHGKWVMLKTLKPQFRDDPRMQSMMEREFDVRYNLAHPHIVMINDIDDVPGIGRCIITDDVYGRSLRSIIDAGELSADHLDKITNCLVSAIDYIQTNHLVHFPIRPETIIFTENVGNLKLIDVGFDQKEQLSPADAEDDIMSYGKVLREVIGRLPGSPAYLSRIADKCTSSDPAHRYHSIHDLRMALAHRTDRKLYIIIIAFLVIVIALLVWLNSASAPQPLV